MQKSLGQVFTSAWQAMKANFPALFLGTLIYTMCTAGLSLLSLLPMQGFDSMYMDSYYSDLQMMSSMAGTMLSSVLLIAASIFLSPLYLGFVASVINAYRLTGQKTPFQIAWRRAKQTYMHYLTTGLVNILFSFVLSFVLSIIAVLMMLPYLFGLAYSPTFDITSSYALLGMMLPMLIVIIVIAALYAMGTLGTSYIPEVEGKSAFRAFFTSFKYMYKGNFWRNLGHTLLMGLIVFGIIFGICMAIALPTIGGMSAYAYDSYYAYSSTYSSIGAMSFPGSMTTIVIILTLVSGAVSSLLGAFTQCYYYEVYLNARLACEAKERVQRLGAGNTNQPY